ncbi:capsular polysaccharide biosynthesis protein CapF [Paenibacillus sp. LHD-117]|uniref:capsular polysaccharide biosynthesis protein CapF n=1 Tax=Paenibacillus sp. LHD-117 TaxID=3071412 RepID=UPI0027DF1C15|nr:capsular polysaccharide biosynthesis protein CapF [Paenibacillus sp. LHD-117]MDQ6420674.1 capsular polysaccharide biosynthesis protein CapF [Paenibacillus sp. LHD-117]
MKILVTGAMGFIGKNLVAELRNRKYADIYEYGRDSDQVLLEAYCQDADFVFHLAGVNRPQDQSEFMNVNYGFTALLLKVLKKHGNKCPILIASSTQAERDNPYGISKKAGEELLHEYSKETGAKVLIYRFTNVFGKWCRPNYNSVVATFCHNIAHGLPITINDSNTILNLVYIDDVVNELINAMTGNENVVDNTCQVPEYHKASLGDIAALISSFRQSREDRSIPDMSDQFVKKLYSTYLSYLPENQFSYQLKMNVDNRGSFTEFIKTPDRGQVSINISKPGISKGNHWHHTKNEKFLVVSGKGVIRFRKIDSSEVIEYFVSGDVLEVVDIPIGYTHNIENLGETDMVTVMWANEQFDPEKPDTFYLGV